MKWTGEKRHNYSDIQITEKKSQQPTFSSPNEDMYSLWAVCSKSFMILYCEAKLDDQFRLELSN